MAYKNEMPITLLTTRPEVERYLDDVRAAADTARASFGFLPKSAYDEFAYQNRMLVAVDTATQALVGYVLYGGAMPQGRVFQTWTAPDARARGVGRRLIEAVAARLERLHYLSLRADVADDFANRKYVLLKCRLRHRSDSTRKDAGEPSSTSAFANSPLQACLR